MKASFDSDELAQFTGTEEWYRHDLNRNVVFTDGVKYLADRAGFHWLLDEIALAQRASERVATERFQVWKLDVNADYTARLTCEDGRGNVLYTKDIGFTDFMGEGVTLWFSNGTIFLPSEY